MELGWNVLWFIIGVSLLVTVHEFGHFWVARKLGFKVLRFSVGFGKPLYKRVGPAPDYTEFVVAAIPLGGYVRMLDERDGEVSPEDRPRAFASKPPWQRILVMLAGPAANFLFAILVLWGIFWATGVVEIRAVVDRVVIGKPAAVAGLRNGDEILSIDGDHIQSREDVGLELLDEINDGTATLHVRDRNGHERDVVLNIDDKDLRHKLTEPNELYRGVGLEFWEPPLPTILGGVVEGEPAAKAGLRPKDEIRAIDGTPVRNFRELSDYVNARPGQTAEFTVRRDGKDFTRAIAIGRDKDSPNVGRLYIEPVRVENPWPPEMRQHYDLGPVAAIGHSLGKTWQMTAAQAKFFWRIVTFDFSWKNMSGFVSIAGYAGDAAHAGFTAFLTLLVLLSLSLGFLNLLPIPILDGGQIVFQIAEWAKGRPLSDRTYMLGQQAGLLLLMLLMGVALFNDLAPHVAKLTQ